MACSSKPGQHSFYLLQKKDATHFWDCCFLRSELRLSSQPSPKFLKGLHAAKLTVYRVTDNNAALHEYAESMGTTWHPPEEQQPYYVMYFTPDPPSIPVMPSGPVRHRDVI